MSINQSVAFLEIAHDCMQQVRDLGYVPFWVRQTAIGVFTAPGLETEIEAYCPTSGEYQYFVFNYRTLETQGSRPRNAAYSA